MELSAMWAIILAVCGGVLTIINAIEKVVGAGKAINVPNVEQDRRIAALEVRCDKYDQYFDSDKQRLSDLERSLSVLMQAQFALLDHAIDGNDTEKLRSAKAKMMDYLTQRGISV